MNQQFFGKKNFLFLNLTKKNHIDRGFNSMQTLKIS